MSSLAPSASLAARCCVEASGTLDGWALHYVESSLLSCKLHPAPPPRASGATRAPLRLAAPGRGPEFALKARGEKSSGASPLLSNKKRMRLVHTFFHHELQAAELMAWALLAFPDAPAELRRGLSQILLDEVRHMHLYRVLLESRGVGLLSMPVRDWFWQRVPTVRDLPGFLATLGLGFEGSNLDHASSFALRFRAAGDEEAARVEEIVGAEEIPHVRFALTWFRELSPELKAGASLFEAFRLSLPPPLSPLLMRGHPIDVGARRRAGLDAAFLEALAAYDPT